ncbi:MAG: TlpA family protein disulfide reductase [Alistipes sp.]|nr:TlpA family protein disulfide reductase [Alistipes sp.]
MKKQTKNLLVLFVVSFALDMVTMPLRGIGFHWCSMVSLPLYVALTWGAIARMCDTASWKVALAVLCGWMLVNVPVRIALWNSALGSLPDAAMHVAGIAAGYLCSFRQRALRIAVLAVCAVLVWQAYPIVIHWLNYLNTGSWSGRCRQPVAGMAIVGERGDTIPMAGRAKVLDFWSFRCGCCISELPDFQSKFEKHGDRADFYAVFLFRDTSDTVGVVRYVRDKGYTFPLAFAEWHSADSLLGIRGVPRYVVVDEVGDMVFYSSGIEMFKKMDFEKNIKHLNCR